jgi:hypothetical protein
MQIRIIKQGRQFFQGDVIAVEEAGTSAIWKDYRKFRGSPLLLLGLWLVRRERKFLNLMPRGTAPLPLAHPDPLVLAMEKIEGRIPQEGDKDVLPQMEALLSHLYRLGIAHNDLHRSNVLVQDGRFFLIDFAGALAFPSYLRWLGFAWLHQRDRHHAHKLAARCGASIQAAQNPAWLRSLQRMWRLIYKREKQTNT